MPCRPPYHNHRQTLGAGDWLRLEQIEYTDRHGHIRTWETANRQGSQKAVFMITILRPSDRFVMIRQYRPPQNGYALEFPAGLIDPGESPECTAVRELREETGYTGQVKWLGPFCLTSPGMSREGVYLAFMEVDENVPENQAPEQACEGGEDIEVILKHRKEIPHFLSQIVKDGTVLDSRLAAYFLGQGMNW